MTLKDLITGLRISCLIVIRDLENYSICECKSDSKGVLPYMDLIVKQWFVYTLNNTSNAICVLIDDREIGG